MAPWVVVRIAVATAAMAVVLPSAAATPAPPELGALAHTVAASSGSALGWRACGRTLTGRALQCAKLSVPLNHDDPAGSRITVGVTRLPAARHSQRVVFVNGGGPGISGDSWLRHQAQHLPRAVRNQATLIGMDPRGLPPGTPAECLPGPIVADSPLQRFTQALAGPPHGRSARRGQFATLTGLRGQCDTNAGPIARHLGTRATAQDLELLRRAVGVDRLDFLGISYGTMLGATYANLYPDRVGRMILDSVVTPNRSWLQLTGIQARGHELSLMRWAAGCRARSGCPFPDAGSAGVQRQLVAEIARLNRSAGPGPATAGEYLGDALVSNLASAFFVGEPYRRIDRIVRQAIEGAAPVTRTAAADPLSAMVSTKWMTVCVDGPVADMRMARFDRVVTRRATRSAVFGRKFTWTAPPCIGFPGRVLRLREQQQPAPLLLNSWDDPATPLAGAEKMAHLFDRATVAIWRGRGHSVTEHGGCPAVIRSFLLSGQRPDNGARCR